MKKYLIILTFLFGLFPSNVLAAVCSKDGYSLLYINGIFTPSAEDAKRDTGSLSDRFFKAVKPKENLSFLTGYNPEHLAGLGDFVQAISQAFDTSISTYDRDTILRTLHSQLTTQKLVLVGHSQGSFYTNEIYHYLVAHGMSPESVAVYNVATPANYVAGNGEYVTSATDKAILAVRELEAKAGKAPLSANILIKETSEDINNPYGGHYFSADYLRGADVRIATDIAATLSNLKSGPSDTADCFTPPEVDLGYVEQKVLFAVADPVAMAAKPAVVTVGKTVGSGLLAALDGALNGYSALAAAAGSMNPLPPANKETVVNAFPTLQALYGSSLSQDDVRDLLGLAVKNDPQSAAVVEVAAAPVPVKENPKTNMVPTVPKAPLSSPPPTPVTPGFGGGGGHVAVAEKNSAPSPEPTVPLTPVLTVDSPSATVSLATTSVTFSGAADPSALVYLVFGTHEATTTADLSGAWSMELVLDEGTTTVSVSTFDEGTQATTTIERIVGVKLPLRYHTLASGYITSDTIWTPDEGILIGGRAEISPGVTLTIEPGTIVKFTNDHAGIYAYGTLDAEGTADAPIYFTSINDDSVGGDAAGDGSAAQPDAGNWQSIKVQSGGSVTLAHAVVRYGGAAIYGPEERANVSNGGGTLNISDSRIEFGAYSGIFSPSGTTIVDSTELANQAYGIIGGGGTTPVLSVLNSDLHGHTSAAITMNGGALTIASTTFSDNADAAEIAGSDFYHWNNSTEGRGGLFTFSSGIYSDQRWVLDGLPYVVSGSFTVPAANTLSIDPGVVIKFSTPISRLDIYGTLDAEGTSAQPIYFTSINDDVVGGDTHSDGSAASPGAGDWKEIQVNPGATATLSHSVVRYGGNGVAQSNIYNAGGTLAVSASLISNAVQSGIQQSSGTLTMTDSEITGMSLGLLFAGGAADISHNSIHDILNMGVSNSGGATVHAQDNFWGDASGPQNSANPTGLGIVVSDNVDFSSWLTSWP